jgi:hypothetical protein
VTAVVTTSSAVAAGGGGQNVSQGQPAARCGNNADYSVERESTIAVNPVNKRNMAIAWQLLPSTPDPVLDTTIIVASTIDGGVSWRRSAVPNLSCSSGAPAGTFTSDPALAFAADGSTLYLTATTNALPLPNGTMGTSGGTTVVVASTSGDGGSTWSRTPSLVGPGDRASVAADPVNPATAYISFGTPFEGPATSIAVSTTQDRGATWSSGTTAYQSSSDQADAPAITAIGTGPAGTKLLVVFSGGLDAKVCCSWILAVRSDDGGRHWSGASPGCQQTVADSCPGVVAEFQPFKPSDEDGTQMNAIPGPSLAAGPDGRAYATWADGNPAAHETDLAGSTGCSLDTASCGTPRSVILVSSSADAGATWSTPHAVNPSTSQASQAFLPTVAVASDCTVGVVYYDFRGDETGDAALTTDLWFARSTDRGDTWTESHLSGPFDLRSVLPDFSDYIDLTTAGKDFNAAIVAARPLATDGSVDVFRLRPAW